MAVALEHLPLLQSAQSGDRLALDQLLRLCKPDIRRYAQRHCLVSDVDDAVQEAMLVLSRRLPSVRVLASLSGWLFRVVQRECRRLGRLALRHDPYDEARVDAWAATRPVDALRMDLAAALESLPAAYRQVIVLRDLEELSISEMSVRLGQTPAAIKSRLHRARLMAREYLLA